MIPEGWREATAEELCSRISVGIVIKPTQYYVDEKQGVRAFRSANIGEGFVRDSDWIHISEDGHAKNKKSALKTNDILIVRTGYPGTACLLPPEYEGSNCIDIIFARPDSEQVVPAYLCTFTNSEYGKKQVLDGSGGLAQQHFNVGAYKKLKLPLPPLFEQKRIAETLQAWDHAIETVEALIANARAQKQALMQQLLPQGTVPPKKRLPGFSGKWRDVSLGALGETYGGLTGKSKDDFGSGSPFITYKNVFENGFVDPKNVERVKVGSGERQHTIRNGDILFTTSSETPEEVGMSSVVTFEAKTIYLNSFCFGFRPSSTEAIRPTFAGHFFRSPSMRRLISALAQGSTRYNISKSALLKLMFQLPNADEQEAIADVLGGCDSDLRKLTGQLTALRQEKAALMQQLLTGKRRVKLPESEVV